MKKIAIFLEGHTETIFVKQMLLLGHDWAVDIECNQLLSGGDWGSANFDHKFPNAEFHYRLICVGNDSIVLRSILQRESYLYEAGYTVIIGLRDMYCQQYDDDCKEINRELIRKFIDTTKQSINSTAANPACISFCYSIMEIESWMIGLNVFHKIHNKLTEGKINAILKIDINSRDPEIKLYRPSTQLAHIYGSVGLTYDKSQPVVMSFCSLLDKEDLERLLTKGCCKSFNYFHSKIF